MERAPVFAVLTHPEAVAADVDDVEVVDEPIHERCGHDLVAEDGAPLLLYCDFWSASRPLVVSSKLA